MYKKYLKKSISFLFLFLFIIAAINFSVDPGQIYSKQIITDDKAKEFSRKLYTSKQGIIQDNWNEREVKVLLAKNIMSFDCIVLGSSHVLQISGIRNTGNITKQCKKVLNLGVSGGSIEDLSIYSYLILNNKTLPKKVFLGIDPWTLKFEMDSRYGLYEEYYNKMNSLLDVSGNGRQTSYIEKAILNLFNGEYLYYSLRSLVNKNKYTINTKEKNKKKIVFPKHTFSYEVGYEKAVILQDGSHVYEKSWIQEQKKLITSIKKGGGDYKINGKDYNLKAVNYLNKIISLYQDNNIKVSIVMTPYHPNVFKMGETKVVKYFQSVSSKIYEIAMNNNIKVYGSFFSSNLNCKENEFFDFMHPTNKCLNRIDFSY